MILYSCSSVEHIVKVSLFHHKTNKEHHGKITKIAIALHRFGLEGQLSHTKKIVVKKGHYVKLIELARYHDLTTNHGSIHTEQDIDFAVIPRCEAKNRQGKREQYS